MKTQKTLKTIALLLVMTLVSFSCSDDDDNNIIMQPMALNIVETAQSNDLDLLVQAVTQAGLVDALTAAGDKTVLAPTNDAFIAFLADNGFNSLSEVPNDVLTQVLLNHVITGSVSSSVLAGQGSGYAKTNAMGAGDNYMSLYFDTTNGVRFNNVASVINGGADISASNGIVHVVDAVIGLPDVVTFATADSRFQTLVTALTTLTPSTDFVSVLQGAGPYTVFAPIDDAFDALPAIPSDETVLTQILLNHVINGTAYSAGDLDGATGYENTMATTPGGENISIYYDGNDGVAFNGMSNVAIPDVVATNGIIHAVDAVITLPTIATFAESNFALRLLFDTLEYADTGMPTVPYIDTVSDSAAGPYTVFAPTNDAFGNLLADLGYNALTDIPTETVDTVLLLHIVGGNIQSSELPNSDITTAGGGIITADNTEFTLTNANGTSNIITTLVDIQGINGVVHVIDRVIR